MARRKLNVLVYTGAGTTDTSVRHCLFSLRQLLSPNYAVIPITESGLLKEPWSPTCAILVFPGGADLGYCRALNGGGNRRIAEYVRRGGAYLGFCAGAYYGSRRCEFEVGNKPLEVIGSRELGFFPGICRGGAFKGFEYHSERGARAVSLTVDRQCFDGKAPHKTTSYCNGGGVFVDAASMRDRSVEVLATYDDETDIDGGDGRAAAVFCHVGQGFALLTGVHPEFAPAHLNPQPGIDGYDDLISKLVANDETRMAFLRACLSKLRLDVVEGDSPMPSLSSLHLSAANSNLVSELLCAWEDITEQEDGQAYIRAETDTFLVQSEDSFNIQVRQELDDVESADHRSEREVVDWVALIKRIVAHEKTVPAKTLTPRFDHARFFSNLKRYRLMEGEAETWGDILLYGDVVTSTNSLLDKNPKLVSRLPTGFTLTATTQVAGRGRGSNVWIAPPGSLMFSVVINHPAHLAVTRPIVFVQYIAAVAVVEAIRSYGEGYEDLPVKLKWPNDIYALDPADKKTYVKIGGILSQCGYMDGSYQVILGIGLNITNPRPTLSLSDLLPSNLTLPPLHIESLLARIITRLESLHADFIRQGFTLDLENRYYHHWLHTGQAVTLEAEGGVRARVLGITRDWGMLRVEEVNKDGKATGKTWALQSDENSFDYWKGLVRRKA